MLKANDARSSRTGSMLARAVPLLALITAMTVARNAAVAEPAAVEIAENERVVHVVGAPFNHAYYDHSLEILLLQRYAARGLVFRRVTVETTNDLLAELDFKVLLHRPTLVVLQTGLNEILRQFRRPTYDFGVYRKPTEEIVKKLRAAGSKVILCSAVPVDNGSTLEKLITPNDGLKQWTEEARQIAAEHGAIFVDLFTEAVGWKMIGNDPRSRYFYDTEGHRKSFELFCKQVQFLPPVSASGVSANPKELKAELERGHQLASELTQIQAYKLPGWIKLADFEEQKKAALRNVLDALEAHDAAVRKLLERPGS